MNLTAKEKVKLWELIKFALARRIPPKQFKAWIQNSTSLKEYNESKAIIATINLVTLNWVQSKASNIIAEVFLEVLGTEPKLLFIVDKKEFPKTEKISNFVLPPSKGHSTSRDEQHSLLDPSQNYKNRLTSAIESSGLNPTYTFDTFVVGPNNEFAHAIATAASENPGKAYNPIFIYGPVGVGKTHLAQAIGNRILEKNPNKKALYCASESFLNEMVEAIKTKGNKDFREKYRKVDILIIDDIQFISGKEATQDEFFHTFNALYHEGKQIVLASDRPPAQIQNLADRLKSRFEGGMIVDIKAPDYETRLAILSKLNDSKELKLSPKIIEKIALNIEDNTRQLIGAYNKVQSYASLVKTPIDDATLNRLLGIQQRTLQTQKISSFKILKTVAKEFKVSVVKLKGDSRKSDIVLPRQIAMFLIRTVLDYPLEKVARTLNRNDHTTVLNAIKKIENLLKIDDAFKERISNLKREIIQAK